MRALRDFNIPKIVTDDRPVFMGLIGDLFPALDVPRKRDMDFEQRLVDAALSMKLQPEPGFILKVFTIYSHSIGTCKKIKCGCEQIIVHIFPYDNRRIYIKFNFWHFH